MKHFILENTWLKRNSSIDFGWGNGYVIIPKGHKLYEKHYDEIHDIMPHLDVHGGLTYSEYAHNNKLIEENEGWVIGFDTAHFSDTLGNWSKERVEEETIKLKQQIIDFFKENNSTFSDSIEVEVPNDDKECRKCGGDCKPSKGYVNYHNIRKSGKGEFKTKLEDCMKCTSCGHSFIPNKEYDSIDTWNLKEGDKVFCRGEYSEFYPKGTYILDCKTVVPGKWYLKSLDGTKEYCLRNGVHESDLELISDNSTIEK